MNSELYDCRFLKTARREPTDTTPIWIMRQAGRYLPEYRQVRDKVSFIELCKRPELAAEVTLAAQRVLNVDAAILFADLLPILEPIGFQLEYIEGKGPVIHNPIRKTEEIDRLRELSDPHQLGFVYEAIKLIRHELPANIPLLGFAGSPFTLASYVIEGEGSRQCVETRKFMLTQSESWHRLMQLLANSVAGYLQEQIRAGCQAVQLFDSWAGCLSPGDYDRYVLPYTKQIIDSLPDDVPVINFLTGNPALLPFLRKAGGDVIGIDWRIDLGEAWKTVGYDVAVQGNLDPVTLSTDRATMKNRATEVMQAAAGRPGHIFNLGHGVFPETNPDLVKELVEVVHELGSR